MIRPHLCPVLRSTPGQGDHLPAAVRVRNQRSAARQACLSSARRLGLSIRELPQNADGVPQPIHGWYWSISHTRGFVGGVIYPAPIGIDVERVRRRRQELVRAAMSQAELELVGGCHCSSFTRIWSAKEAVLKMAGCGLAELSRCVLVAAPTPRSLILHHRDRMHYVFQCFKRGHYVSVCADGADAAEIAWDWGEDLVPPDASPGGPCE